MDTVDSFTHILQSLAWCLGNSMMVTMPVSGCRTIWLRLCGTKEQYKVRIVRILGRIYVDSNKFNYAHMSYIQVLAKPPPPPPPSAANIRRWTGSALTQSMAGRLFGAMPLPELMLIYCQLDPFSKNWIKILTSLFGFCHYHEVINPKMTYTQCNLKWYFLIYVDYYTNVTWWGTPRIVCPLNDLYNITGCVNFFSTDKLGSTQWDLDDKTKALGMFITGIDISLLYFDISLKVATTSVTVECRFLSTRKNAFSHLPMNWIIYICRLNFGLRGIELN